MAQHTMGPWTNSEGLVSGRVRGIDDKDMGCSFDIFDASEAPHESVEDEWYENAKIIGAALETKQQRDELLAVLKDARPVVANAAADPEASPWQTETRKGILQRIDDAISSVMNAQQSGK